MIIRIWSEKVDVWVCIGQCFRHCFGVYKLFIYHVFYVWNGCAMWCLFWWSIVKWMNHEISLRTNVKLDEKVQKNSGINFQKLRNRFKKNLEFFGCQRIKKKRFEACRDRTQDLPAAALTKKKGFKKGMLGAGIEPATPSYARNELKGRKGTRGVGIDPTTSALKGGRK